MDTTVLSLRTPLELPELRHRISRFVTVKDALSCALVCKAWTADFVSVIWHSIDFKKQFNFASLSPDIISKHGHHIRIVHWIHNDNQILLLNNPAVAGLKELKLYYTISYLVYYPRVNEIIHRNIHSLQSCTVFLNRISTIHNTSSLCQILAPNLTPVLTVPHGLQTRPPTLTELIIRRAFITHEELITVLQQSPSLDKLFLDRSPMFREGSATLAFKHMNLKRLEGTISCIFPRNTPSLLSYFPNLRSLEVWTDGIQILLPTSKIKADIANYCPYLTEYGLRDNDDFIIQFCDFIVDHPTHIRFDFDFISTQVIDALLQHRASLKVISLYASNKKFSYETDNMAEVSAVFRESGHLLQQIPRTCPKLEELDLYLHEMEMKDIEGGEWLCKDLRTLRIRIKGLDTKEKVIKALEMWQNGSRERWRKQAIRPSNKTRKDTKKNAEEKKDGEEHEIIDTSIEARVAHHLLKFEKLKKVWLGYQTWSLL